VCSSMRAPASFLKLFGVGILALPITWAVTAKRDTPVAQAAPMEASKASNIAARLPWSAGTSLYLTQDANDDCCSDHVGSNKWAYDFAAYDGGTFDVVAPQAGTVVHVKMASKHGCGDASCVNDANYVVIDHGDGTQTTMLHLAYGSLDPAVKCGAFVRRGQRLAVSGSTGWSTGIHLHVERDQVKKNLKQTCECGPDGLACQASSSHWSLFWPSLNQPNVATRFAEWSSADAPKNRRGMIGPSTNVDDHEELVTLAADRFAFSGDWADHKTFRTAHADGKSTAKMSLKGAITKSGAYEVWALAPLASQHATSDTTISIGKSTGTLEGGTAGGAYLPVKGLERVMLDSSAEELTVTGAIADKDIVAPAILLRRTGPMVSDPSLQVAKK
jgi:hypothetical protein